MKKLTYTLCLLFILSSSSSFCMIETNQDSIPKKRDLLGTIQMEQEVGLFLPLRNSSRETNPFQKHTRLLGSYSNINMSFQVQKNLSVGFLMSYNKYFNNNHFYSEISSSSFTTVRALIQNINVVDRSTFFSTLSMMPGIIFQTDHYFHFGFHLGPNILKTNKYGEYYSIDDNGYITDSITVTPNKSVGVKANLSSKYVLTLKKAKITIGSNVSFWSNTISFRTNNYGRPGAGEQTPFSKRRVSQLVFSIGFGYIFQI